MIDIISHPTDFSPEGQAAFLHALRLALAFRCRLDLLHVRDPDDDDGWTKFPHVREILERWGLLAPGASVADIEAQTGVAVHKVEIHDDDAVEGLSRFLVTHRPDLVVMASHGRKGLNRWLSGSVSTKLAQETRVPVLLLGPAAKPFVDAQSGAMSLAKVLVPVAHEPRPDQAVRILEAFTAGLDVGFDFVHAGKDAPHLVGGDGAPIAVRAIEGPVVESILGAAEAGGAQMIAMPTAGQQGILDALRGSTTEQVMRRAPCPVLTIPALP